MGGRFLTLLGCAAVAAMSVSCTKAVEELPDGMIIQGGGLHGAELDGCGDHRIVMALAVAALAADSPSVIHGVEAAAVTYPDFVADFQRLGAAFEIY